MIEEIKSNTGHIHHDAMLALNCLLERQSEPLYATGRSYHQSLVHWSERIASGSPLKKNARTTSSTHDITLLPSSALLSLKKKHPSPHSSTATRNQHIGISPRDHPELLLRWRARVIEWMFDLADALHLDRNTAVTSVGYLDAYSMYNGKNPKLITAVQ